jgi:single-strand DNA-binding protein
MKDLNKVILTGNLGRDPEMLFTPNGNAVVRLNLGSHRKVRQEDGSYLEKTQWTRVALWNKLAEIASEYLTKGSRVMVEGRLETRQYQDSQGATRWITEVVASEMFLLGNNPAQPQPDQTTPAAQVEAETEEETQEDLSYPLPALEEEAQEEEASQPPVKSPHLRVVVPAQPQPQERSATAEVEATPVVLASVPEAKADPWSQPSSKEKAARQIFENKSEPEQTESLPLPATGLISTEQLAKIEQLVKDKGYSSKAADGTALKLFGVKVKELNQAQAEEMLTKLQLLKPKDKDKEKVAA